MEILVNDFLFITSLCFYAKKKKKQVSNSMEVNVFSTSNNLLEAFLLGLYHIIYMGVATLHHWC